MDKPISIQDLSQPNARFLLLNYIGEQVIFSLSSILGAGSLLYQDIPKGVKPECRGITISLEHLNEVLTKATDDLSVDIVKTGIRHFVKLPLTPNLDCLNFERNGIAIRVGLVKEPPTVHIDYHGWK